MVNIVKTKERVYYKDVVVVEQAVNGTYSFTPEKDVLCEITLVGAGAGGAFNSSRNRSSAAAGGSGSGCILLAVLKAGQTYNAVVGKGGVVVGGLDATATGGRGGNSYIEVVDGAILANAEGGIGGNVWWPNGSSQGALAPLPTVNSADANIEFQKWLFIKRGIPGAIGGNPSAGGASVIDGTTYGQGGRAWNAGGSSRGEVGKDGYIKVVYKEPTKGPENLNALTHSGRNVYMAAGESINIPDGKNGNVNKFLTVTTQESSAFLNSDDDDFYLWIDTSGKLFLRATKYFYFQEEEPTEARQLKYWYKPSEHIWRLTEDNGATWQIYEMGVIGRAWQDYSTGDISDAHYEPYGEWDNYEDVIKSYVAKRKIRRYYKYTYAPWSQPILTSDTSYGAVSSIGIREGQVQAYKALDGVKSGTPSTMQGWVSNTNTVGAWWMWKVPVKLKINSIKFYNQHSGNNNNIFTAQFFADQAATIPLSAPFTTLAGAYSVVDVPCIYDGITDCIYFKCLSITSNNVGIGELKISADYVTGSEVSTSDDYDFYNDVTSCYVAKRKIRKYYKYKYEDYTLPVMTSNTAPEGTVTTNIPTSTWTTNPYSVFWNRSANWNYWHRNATGERYLQYDFVTPLIPDVYRLTLRTFRQSNVTTSIHNWYLIYEDGTKELILNYGKVPTSSTEYSKEITASKPVKAVRYELNAQASADSGAVEYISYLNFVSKSTDYISVRKILDKVEVSSTDDYDFYEDIEY